MALQDSQLEDSISASGYQLTDIYLPCTFTDRDCKTFQAKSDAIAFKDNQLTVIEFKGGKLNSHQSIATCRNKLYAQCNYRRVFINPNGDHNHLSQKLWKAECYKDCLDHAWNHAIKKHQIVNDGLKKLGINYLVVFTNHPAMIKYRKDNVYMQNFYKFPTMHYHEFKDKFKTSDLVTRIEAKQLINSYLLQAA